MWNTILGQLQESTQYDDNRPRRSSESASHHSIQRLNDGTEGGRRRSSATSSPTHHSPHKRYAVYKLDSDNPQASTSDNTRDSALVARRMAQPPNSPVSTQQITSTTSTVVATHDPVPIDAVKNSTYDPESDRPTSPYGGITVTKVQVVEYHSATKDESSSQPTQIANVVSTAGVRSDVRRSVEAFEKRLSKIKHQHSYSDSDLNAVSSARKSRVTQIIMPLVEKNQLENQKQSNPKVGMDGEGTAGRVDGHQKNKKRASLVTSKGKGKRSMAMKNAIQPEMPSNSYDERQINAAQLRKLKRSGATVYKKQKGRPLLRHMEFAPTSNPAFSNDPTDLEDDLPLPLYDQRYPWVPKSHQPPQLLHGTLVPLPKKTNRANAQSLPMNPNRNSRILASHGKRGSQILSTHSNRSSQLISCKPNAITRIIGSNQKRLSRVASQRKRSTIIMSSGKRSSVLLRRKLLEDSVMMSLLGGARPTAQTDSSVNQTKTIIRRKTKKGSNAVIEDKEARRERRRRERRERKRLENLSENADDKSGKPENNPGKVENPLEITRIVEARELVKKVEEEEEGVINPLPPPRRTPPADTPILEDAPPKKHQSNASSFLYLGNRTAEQRPVKLDVTLEQPSGEPPPFPSHLARSPISPRLPTNIVKQLPVSTSDVDTALEDDQPTTIHSVWERNDSNDFNQTHADVQGYTFAIPAPQVTEHGKRTKSGIAILGGFFNKQSSHDSGHPHSPPFYSTSQSPMSSSFSSLPSSPHLPTSPSLFSPLPTPLISRPLPSQSPESLVQQNPRSNRNRRTTHSSPASPPAVTDPEKLRKMQDFEALVAGVDATKKQKTRKKRANTTASTATVTTIPSIYPLPPIPNLRSKTTDYPPSLSPGSSSSSGHRSNESSTRSATSRTPIDDQQIESRGSVAVSVTDSVAESVAESFTVHYQPEEREELGKGRLGEDGVIRVTLTPAVCR